MQYTTKEFAEKTGVDQVVANSVLNFLVAKGQATLMAEKRKTSTGKGRAANVYEVPDTITLTF